MDNSQPNWEEREKQNRKKGAITTGVVHLVLLILFIFLGLTSAYPPPTEGILINFGTMETGRTAEPSKVIEEVDEITPEKVVTPPPPETVEEVIQEDVVTQDIEETVAIEPEEEPEVAPEVEPDETEKVSEPEPVIEEAEEPVEDVVEEEPEPEPVVDPKALFSGQKSDENKPTDEGSTYEKGDQGVETGDPSSNNYDGDVSFGLGNSGVGWDLTGRDLLSIPPIQDKSQETGTVAVRIKVDRNGKIVFAKYTTKGSTTTDAYLISLAEKAARDAKFNADRNAPEEQFGTITFTFKLK